MVHIFQLLLSTANTASYAVLEFYGPHGGDVTVDYVPIGWLHEVVSKKKVNAHLVYLQI